MRWLWFIVNEDHALGKGSEFSQLIVIETIKMRKRERDSTTRVQYVERGTWNVERRETSKLASISQTNRESDFRLTSRGSRSNRARYWSIAPLFSFRYRVTVSPSRRGFTCFSRRYVFARDYAQTNGMRVHLNFI